MLGDRCPICQQLKQYFSCTFYTCGCDKQTTAASSPPVKNAVTYVFDTTPTCTRPGDSPTPPCKKRGDVIFTHVTTLSHSTDLWAYMLPTSWRVVGPWRRSSDLAHLEGPEKETLKPIGPLTVKQAHDFGAF